MNENPLLALDNALNVAQELRSLNERQLEDSSEKAAKALSSVLTYIISDAFDLSGEEALWVGYYIGDLMAPMNKIRPAAQLLAVQEELKYGEYSNKLFRHTSSDTESSTNNSSTVNGVQYAPMSTWVEGMSDIIFTSYPNLTPMYKSRIIGSLHGIFTELGLDNNLKKTRPSLYLPNAIRYLLTES